MSVNKKLYKITIGFKLVSIISALIILSLSGMIFLANYYFKDTMRSTVEKSNLDYVIKVSLKVEADFLAILERAEIVSSALTGELGAAASDNLGPTFFSRDKDLIYIGVSAIDSQTGSSAIKASIMNEPFLEDSPGGKGSVDKALAEDSVHYEKAFSGQTEIFNASSHFGQSVIGICSPLSRRDLNHADSISIVYLKADRFLDLVRSPDIRKTFIVNGEGNVLAHYDLDLVSQGSNLSNLPIVKAMMESESSNAIKDYTYEGVQYLGSFNKLSFGGVGVVVTVDSSAAFEGAEKIRKRNFMILSIVLSLAILVVWFFSKTITEPITHLAEAAEQIEAGNFAVTLKPSSRDEIGLLTEQFVAMGNGLAERERIKSAFTKFVDEDLAEKALRGEIKLGGERKNVTIFFSDIRAFTEISEQLEPEEVVEFLNEYMTRMVECVEKTDGKVNKFIGDAIMAIWGISDSTVNHTECSINAALMMRKSLAEFNSTRGAPRKPIIKIGCGINSGPVISGQIGSQHKMEYTVIGDAVNLASRIESLNKAFGTDILISHDAYENVKDIFRLVPMEKKIKIKGKIEPQQVFTVLSRLDDPQGVKTLDELRKQIGIVYKENPNFDPDNEEKKYEIVG